MAKTRTKQKSIIAFGAHPDDIEIGMGGTLKKLAAVGQEVITVIAVTPNQKAERKRETQRAAAVLGVGHTIFLDIPLTQFGFNRKTIGAIDKIIQKFNPGSIFTHWTGDSHQDHINLTNCVLAGARHNHFNVYMYEQTIPGGITHMHFRPQLFVDISHHIDDKIRSIQEHKSQCLKYGDGWIEGLRGRAMHRGYQIKTDFAEAFEIIKIKEETNLFNR